MFTKNKYRYELGDLTFRMEVVDDEHTGFPWVEHDGHGVVVQGNRYYKSDRYEPLIHDYFYDRMSSLELAKRDGWGPGTPEQAVESDLKYLLAWCRGDWRFVGVRVTIIRAGRVVAQDSLWGIENTDRSYLVSTGNDLADNARQMLVDDAKAILATLS